jgi:hypothetical protein
MALMSSWLATRNAESFTVSAIMPFLKGKFKLMCEQFRVAAKFRIFEPQSEAL